MLLPGQVTPDYELYAAFDALTDRAAAARCAAKLAEWLKAQQSELFCAL